MEKVEITITQLTPYDSTEERSHWSSMSYDCKNEIKSWLLVLQLLNLFSTVTKFFDISTYLFMFCFMCHIDLIYWLIWSQLFTNALQQNITQINPPISFCATNDKWDIRLLSDESKTLPAEKQIARTVEMIFFFTGSVEVFGSTET